MRLIKDGPGIPPNPLVARTGAISVDLQRGDDVQICPIGWVWPGWLAAGKLHVLAGAPGTGKTTLALSMAATITAGGWWPDGAHARPADVVIWSGEDDPADTLAPRLLAMGADMTRVLFLRATVGDGERRAFEPARDLPHLRATLRLRGITPELLVVDPIVSVVTGDSHKNAEVRQSLAPLVDMAAEIGFAVMGVSHFTKGTSGRDPVERVTGSLAFGALARIVMAAAKQTDDQGGGRLLARAKSNIGPDGGGYAYELEVVPVPGHPGVHTTRVVWGDALEGTARDLLAEAEPDEERSATTEAVDWLRELLAAGPVEAAVVQREARAAGITDKPLRLARERLGVTPRKRTFSGGWVWELGHLGKTAKDDPSHTKMPPRCPTQNEGILGKERASSVDEGILGESSKMPSVPEDALSTCPGIFGASSGEGILGGSPESDDWEQM